MFDHKLLAEVDRIVSGDYHACPFPLETWQQRFVNLEYFTDDDAALIVRTCAQLAANADAVMILTTKGKPFGPNSWRAKMEDVLATPPEERAQFDRVLTECAKRADALETFWRAMAVRAGVFTG